MVNERLKQTKKALLPRTWVISFIVFTSIFTLMFLGSQEMLTDYDASSLVGNEYNNSYNKFDDVISNSGESYEEIFADISDGSGFVVFDTAIGLMNAFAKTVKITFGSVSVLMGMGTDFVEDFGVPEAVANVVLGLISAVLAVFLIFAIISSASRSNRI